MAAILLVPILHLFILMGFSFLLTISLIIQLIIALWNVIMRCHYKKQSSQYPVLNFYLFHHIFVCIIRCLIIFSSCLSILYFNRCLSIEIFIHFLLLLSTFDLLLIIIGETAHFWDSSINHKSSLYSKCCLIFGMIFNYFVSILFFSIHLTMKGDNPVLMELCQITTKKFFLIQNNTDDKSLIPILITYVLFILIDLLTISWIYVSYKDIYNLKGKRLATVFFYSLVFTKFKEHERVEMVNQSLNRLLAICLFLISNIIVTLPVLTIKIFNLSLNIPQRLVLVYLTTLPWMDCITFFFYNETRFNCKHCFAKKIIINENYHRQKRIGRRLSLYRESVHGMQIVAKK